MKVDLLPESFLRCMSAEDRKAFGKGGLTAAEALERTSARNEKELQRQIISYLRLRGIEPIVNRMDRKTSNNVGVPDLLFAVTGQRASDLHPRVFACAFEVKMKGSYPGPEQIRMRDAMTGPPNGWTYRLIRSLDEVKEFLDDIGIP